MQEAKQKKIAHFCSIDELRRLVLWMRCQCTCARRQAEFFHYACIRMPEVAIARSHRDCASRTTLHPSFDPVVRHRRWEASDAIDCIYHRDGMRVVCVCVWVWVCACAAADIIECEFLFGKFENHSVCARSGHGCAPLSCTRTSFSIFIRFKMNFSIGIRARRHLGNVKRAMERPRWQCQEVVCAQHNCQWSVHLCVRGRWMRTMNRASTTTRPSDTRNALKLLFRIFARAKWFFTFAFGCGLSAKKKKCSCCHLRTANAKIHFVLCTEQYHLFSTPISISRTFLLEYVFLL